jgi:hypothetical protein
VELGEPRRREYSWFPFQGPTFLVQFNQVDKYVGSLLYTHQLEVSTSSLTLTQEPPGLLAGV